MDLIGMQGNNSYLPHFNALAREFADTLRKSGISEDTIQGIKLFDVGDSVAMPFLSAKGIIAFSYYREAKGLALARWLVEHLEEEHTPRFRENVNRLEILSLTLNQISISSDVMRGQRTLKGAKAGHEAVHGTVEEKEKRRNAYCVKLQSLHEVHTSWSFEELKRHTARHFKVSTKTIGRCCENPHKLRKS